ncbi:MAG TPA: YegP family protein [Kofleriaceae bacterium]|jgi:hypothetical protein
MRSTILAFAAALSLAACATEPTASTDGTNQSTDDSSGTGKFDVWQASDQQWHFHLKSGNGAILLTSEAYADRTGAINGALAMMNDGVDPAQYAVVAAAHGYLLHVNAGNNEIIGFSETYSTKSNATRAIGSCVNAVTTYLDAREANTTGARFDVEAGTTGQFHFDVYAKNGQVVLSSESYTTAAAAWNGAFAVEDAGQISTSYKLLQATNGKWYFTVNASNGQVVGTSQLYSTKSNATAGAVALENLLPSIAVF